MRVIPIAREGYPFILIALVPTVAAYLLGAPWWVTLPLAGLTVFVVAFFRDPERRPPDNPGAIVSPADGKVIKIDEVVEERLLGERATRICIFMNLFNVHVNRAPASGRVVKVLYNPGKFFSANLDKASLENEQNALLVETPQGRRFVFNQIAGLVARRIVCYATEGTELTRGERFGLIRFGSRLDVYIPTDCPVTVKLGDKVRAGKSVLGLWT